MNIKLNISKIYLLCFREFDRYWTWLINITILRFSFFITEQHLKLKEKLYPRDESEGEHD